MTVEVQGDTVFAGGPVGNDLPAFERALAGPGVARVAFVNSPGGDLWTGLRVGRLIAERGLATVVAGHCNSACAIMFMGGRERRFADNLAPALTHVGLHGAHRTDTKTVDAVLQPQIYAWLRARMGERFDPAIVNQALYEMDDAGGMLRVYDVARTPRRTTLHCRGAQTPRRECTAHAGADALTLGVVTHADLVSLDLPAAFRAAAALFGQPLGAPLGDVAAWLAQIAEGACSTDSCRQRLQDWGTRREHWALAVGLAGGWGRSEGRDTPLQAALAALSRCNHRDGGAAVLCELEAVDGLAAREGHRRADAAHAAARAAIVPPAERHHANEEFGGGLARAGDALRTQRLRDITPAQLAGIRTVATGDLAAWLRAAAPPVVVDVGQAAESLPGALALWNGGLAFDDARDDEAFDARFRALLARIAPDRAAPVVFYCESRQCWQSVNAARRALRAGWQQVAWYRGGLESWRAASLPLAPAQVRAVAH